MKAGAGTRDRRARLQTRPLCERRSRSEPGHGGITGLNRMAGTLYCGVTVFLYRPLVFISSSIRELRQVREATRIAIEELRLAEAWLYEVHAAASGEPPDAQYLSRARSSDVFVIIIADQITDATWAEYEEAHGDSPTKVLPFFVGPPTDVTQGARETIRSRHAYKRVDDVEDIPDAVATAIEQLVTSFSGQRLTRGMLVDRTPHHTVAWFYANLLF